MTGRASCSGKPHLRRDRLFHPLFKIARIECPDCLPVAGRILALGPIGLGGPVARRDKDKGAFGPLGLRDGSQACPVIALGLAARPLICAELPA